MIARKSYTGTTMYRCLLTLLLLATTASVIYAQPEQIGVLAWQTVAIGPKGLPVDLVWLAPRVWEGKIRYGASQVGRRPNESDLAAARRAWSHKLQPRLRGALPVLEYPLHQGWLYMHCMGPDEQAPEGYRSVEIQELAYAIDYSRRQHGIVAPYVRAANGSYLELDPQLFGALANNAVGARKLKKPSLLEWIGQ